MNVHACSAPQTSPATVRPLALAGSLRRLQSQIQAAIARGEDDERQARRRMAAAIVRRALASPQVDTVATFELVLNRCLDVGYRAQPLAAFVFDALHRRIAGRVRRRLAASGQDPDQVEVADLVASTAEAIYRLIRGADRERHSLRYALLVSIADHRTIDFLRRRRPEYRDTMDDQAAGQASDGASWPFGDAEPDPERGLLRRHRQALAAALRVAILAAVNELPDRERAALVLVEIDGLGYDEVAERLRIKRTDVGNLVRRARLTRDRVLVRRLRDIPGLDGHVGFTALQTDRDLRLNMLSWTSEMGYGVCAACRDAGGYHLHPAEAPCPAAGIC